MFALKRRQGKLVEKKSTEHYYMLRNHIKLIKVQVEG